MASPHRWPVNANKARQCAIDAAEDSIDALIDVAGDIAAGRTDEALVNLKKATRLQNYIIRTLIDAKHGEAPDKLPEEVMDDTKQ